MNRQYLYGMVVGVFLGAIITAVSLTLLKQTKPAAIVIEPPPPPPTAVPTPTPAPLSVFVNGAVVKPDVYQLPPGSRVEEAIAQAQGFTGDANVDLVNLALPLQDGMQIYVPTLDETAENSDMAVRMPETAVAIPAANQNTGTLVNINTATAADLDALPGIGPSTAQKIIDYRDANGPFATIQAIMEVPGIGESKFAEIESLITVGN
ncbi:MAG: hypothetical protein D6835_04830, partial [Candidatus Thermofonsia bacterium]